VLRREFELLNGSSFGAEWAEPQPDGNGDFRCAYSFNLGGRNRSSYAIGVDAVQAVMLALMKAHVELLASPEGRRQEITWLGGTELGLPLPNGTSASDFLSGRPPE
jgi:hypothetical protein